MRALTHSHEPTLLSKETQETCFYEVSLPSLQARLVLNFQEQIVSLVQVQDSPSIRVQTRLTRNEWRVFLLLLTHPEGSTYAQVMASLQCSEEVWYTTLIELADKSGDTWHKRVLAWEEAFQHAKHQWKREVKPIHEVILHLRRKLRQFGLRIPSYDPVIGYLLQPSSGSWPHMEALFNEQACASLGEVVASFVEEQTEEELSSRTAPKKEGS
jgi:hypothetical protein